MSRVEIRTYEGDGTDLVRLVNRAWTSAFGGKMWFPLWDSRYFAWRLLDGIGQDRDFLIAAYQGSMLVGCLLSEPLDMRIRGQPVRGALTSWMSVDTGTRTPDVAIRLVEGLTRRRVEHGIRLSLGVTSADLNSPMRRLWTSLAIRKPEEIRFLSPVWFWTRAFDAEAVSQAGLSVFERACARVSGHIRCGWIGWRTPSGVRRFQSTDLERCLGWVRGQAARADLAIDWSRSRLERQLAHPYVTTLVIDDGDRGGFINYYSIDYLGARPIRVSVVDLCAGTLGLARQLDLLDAAGRQMVADGATMSMMMMSKAAPATPLLAAGYLPLPAGLDLMTVFADPGLPLGAPLGVHTLFT